MLEVEIEKVREISKKAVLEVRRRPWAYLVATGGICLTAVVLALPQSIESPEQGAAILNPSNRVFTTNLYRHNNPSGYILGPRLVIAECSGATQFEIRPDSQHQGFMESSGGFRSKGKEPIIAQTYLNSYMSNGRYVGVNEVRCLDDQGKEISETTIVYDFTLFD